MSLLLSGTGVASTDRQCLGLIKALWPTGSHDGEVSRPLPDCDSVAPGTNVTIQWRTAHFERLNPFRKLSAHLHLTLQARRADVDGKRRLSPALCDHIHVASSVRHAGLGSRRRCRLSTSRPQDPSLTTHRRPSQASASAQRSGLLFWASTPSSWSRRRSTATGPTAAGPLSSVRDGTQPSPSRPSSAPPPAQSSPCSSRRAVCVRAGHIETEDAWLVH